MHVLFCYSKNWADGEINVDDSVDHIAHLVVEINHLPDVVDELGPDVIFLMGYDQDDLTAKVLRKICTSHHHLEIIPYGTQLQPEFLLAAMELGIRDVLRDLHPNSIFDLLLKAKSRVQLARDRTKKNATKIAFMSAKGGDGGTCLAANFAYAIANAGDFRVLCVDLSLPFGDLEMYLTRQKSQHDLSEFATEIERLDGALLELMVTKIKSNFHIIGSPDSFDKVVLINAEHIDRLVSIASEIYDYIIFDVGAGIDPISIRILEKLDRLFIVTTLTVPSIKRSSQLLNLWETLNNPLSKVSIIVNRVTEYSEITIEDLESTLGKRVVKQLPTEYENIQQSLIKGRPIVECHPDCNFSQVIMKWVADYTGQPVKHKKTGSLWNRLKGK